MPELGSLSKTEVAALAGLAPQQPGRGGLFPRSASYRRKVVTAVRTGLWMPTLVAVQHNPILKALYLRLRAKGKPAKDALTACARKLLIYLNSLLKNPLLSSC